MSKRSRRRARRAANQKQQSGERRQQNGEQEEKRFTSNPWLSRQTGFRAIWVISLVLAAFMTWQLWPAEGPIMAILWGVGFGAAIWGVFFLSLAFNTWVRGRGRRNE